MLPQVESDAEEYAAALAELVAGRGYSLLIPGTDQSLRTLSARRDLFEDHVRLALPPHSTVLDALDKVRLGEFSAAVGMPAPDTAYCENIGEALSAAERFGYPVHLKPQLVVTKAGSRVMRYGSEVVDGARRSRGDRLRSRAPVPRPAFDAGRRNLVRRRACRRPAPSARCLALDPQLAARQGRLVLLDHDRSSRRPRRRGRPLARSPRMGGYLRGRAADRRRRGFPHDRLESAPVRIPGARDSRGGKPPEAWASWVLGREPAYVVARAGVRYRWEDGDARWALRRLHQARWREAAAIARPHRGTAHAYLSWDDPGPFVARAVEGLTKSRAP